MAVKIKYLIFGLALALNTVSAQNNTVSARYTFMSVTDLTNLHFIDNLLKEYNLNQEVIKNSELEKNVVGEMTNIYYNPIMVNGQPVKYSNFGLFTKGILSVTVLKGQPETAKAILIPFYVSIRRNGKIIEDKKMPFLNKQLYNIDLSEIFRFSKDGDNLIIKPARAEDWKAKRILKLREGC